MDERIAGTATVLVDRGRFLRRLVEAPATRSELAAELSVSPSTVDRALRELETHGLADRSEGEHRATTLGRAVLAEYDRFLAALSSLVAARPVLEGLPATTSVPRSLLLGAEVVAATAAAPYEPFDRFLDDVAASDRVRMVATLPVVRYVEAFDDSFLQGTDAQVVIPAESVGRLVGERPEWFVGALSSPNVEIRESAATPPATVAHLETGDGGRALLAVGDADGIRGYATNDTGAAVDWAVAFVSEHWEAAIPLSPQS